MWAHQDSCGAVRSGLYSPLLDLAGQTVLMALVSMLLVF